MGDWDDQPAQSWEEWRATDDMVLKVSISRKAAHKLGITDWTQQAELLGEIVDQKAARGEYEKNSSIMVRAADLPDR